MGFFKKKHINLIEQLDTIASKIYFKESPYNKYTYIFRNKPFSNTPLSDLPTNVRQSFSAYNDIEQEEYFAEIEGTNYLEPTTGLIFDKKLKTYYSCSIPYNYLERKPSFLKIKLRLHKILKFDTVISIRYYFQNYWHFFNDVLGQLSLIDEKGISSSTPIIIPDGVLHISFIKQIIDSNATLKNRNWVELKRGTLIQANRIIVAKNLPNTKLNFTRVLGLMQISSFEASPNTTAERKIFLKRGPSRVRSLSNSLEIAKIAVKFGLEIIDNDTLSFEEQRNIFANASLVVGIHGAGLTNLIFRFPKTLELVEIFPKNLIPPHYYWLSHQLNFGYNCIIGEDEIENSFFLNPKIFEDSLKRLESKGPLYFNNDANTL